MKPTDTQLRQGLLLARDALRQEFESVKARLTQVEEMLATTPGDADEPGGLNAFVPKLSPLPIVRKLFDDSPDRTFTTTEVRQFLEAMQQQGRLESSSKRLIVTARDVCNRLTNQGFLQMLEEGKVVKYRRQAEPQEDGD